MKDDWRMDDRRVSLTHVGGLTVSTVRLPIDHGYGSVELWYETMIFPTDSLAEIYCERYTTKEQAIQGHFNAVRHAGKLEMEK